MFRAFFYSNKCSRYDGPRITGFPYRQIDDRAAATSAVGTPSICSVGEGIGADRQK